MTPRVRVALAIIGVALVTAFVLTQVYFIVLAPLLQWRGERAEDRAAYQKISVLKTRAEVEESLADWNAERLEGTRYCELLVKRRAPGSESCKSADHEVAYQRKRAAERAAPLTPLRIVVIYDRDERVVTTSTLD